MLTKLLHRARDCQTTTSAPEQRIQRLEREHAELRSRLEGERQLRILAAQIVGAAQTAPVIGSAVEKFAQAMRAPLARGRAGGLARARQGSRLGERWSDGRFMAHENWEQIEREIAEAEYMRYAAGGFARVASAHRYPDGTFAPRSTGSLVR
jgi:hypothetical protein